MCEKLEPGAAVALALDEFQPRRKRTRMTLHGAVAEGQLQGGADSRGITVQTLRKALGSSRSLAVTVSSQPANASAWRALTVWRKSLASV